LINEVKEQLIILKCMLIMNIATAYRFYSNHTYHAIPKGHTHRTMTFATPVIKQFIYNILVQNITKHMLYWNT